MDTNQNICLLDGDIPSDRYFTLASLSSRRSHGGASLVSRGLWLKWEASGGSLEFLALCLSGSLPACRKRSRADRKEGGREEGRGGGVQRAGLVGDQMSSQWGRNVEVRMEGRREV